MKKKTAGLIAITCFSLLYIVWLIGGGVFQMVNAVSAREEIDRVKQADHDAEVALLRLDIEKPSKQHVDKIDQHLA